MEQQLLNEEENKYFLVETFDGKQFPLHVDILKYSPYLKNEYNDLDIENNKVLKIPHQTVTGEIMAFIHGHLKLHSFNPPGFHAEVIKKHLVENLSQIDYDYVKHLEGVDNIPETAKYLKALCDLDIKALRQVYICIIATEYTLEDRTIEEMNEKFKHLLPEKYKNYTELTQERMDELNEFFPFMKEKEEQKRRQQEKEQAEKMSDKLDKLDEQFPQIIQESGQLSEEVNNEVFEETKEEEHIDDNVEVEEEKEEVEEQQEEQQQIFK